MLLESTIAYVFGVNTNEITVGMCLKFIHMVLSRINGGIILTSGFIEEMRAEIDWIKNGE